MFKNGSLPVTQHPANDYSVIDVEIIITNCAPFAIV